MNIATMLLDCFRGRTDVVAVGSTDAFHPEDGPCTVERLEAEHLAGVNALGFYLLDDDNHVLCSCADFDNKSERPDPEWRIKAERAYFLLANVGLSPLVEVSQSGEAAHVWLFFSEPTEAWLVRAFWRALFTKLNEPCPEIYPKQDKHSGKGLGNLVRYPLWSKSFFPDVESQWEPLDPETALSGIRKTDSVSLKLVAWDLGTTELKPESSRIENVDGPLPSRVLTKLQNENSLLTRRWYGDTTGMADPSRSSLVQSIACELVRVYVPTPEVVAAVRYWCDSFGYDKGRREEWVQTTVSKAYDFVLSRAEQMSETEWTLESAALEYLESLKNNQRRYVPSGIAKLDYSIEGVGFGEMAILAARPGHGKSALAMQWMDHASSLGINCLFISEEMSRIEVGRRIICNRTELDEKVWRHNADDIGDDVREHFKHRAKVIGVDAVSTIDRAEEVIEKHCSISGVRLVAVDYMQFLGSRFGRRYEDVTDIAKRLKQAARKNGCAILVCTQLNRAVENRDNFEPKSSDLRESGQIEQDADLITFLQWPLRFDSKYQDPEEYRIIITKRRNGPIKVPRVLCAFNPQRQIIGWDPDSETNWDSEPSENEWRLT